MAKEVIRSHESPRGQQPQRRAGKEAIGPSPPKPLRTVVDFNPRQQIPVLSSTEPQMEPHSRWDLQETESWTVMGGAQS